jgi:hypothetical protein
MWYLAGAYTPASHERSRSVTLAQVKAPGTAVRGGILDEVPVFSSGKIVLTRLGSGRFLA